MSSWDDPRKGTHKGIQIKVISLAEFSDLHSTWKYKINRSIWEAELWCIHETSQLAILGADI